MRKKIIMYAIREANILKKFNSNFIVKLHYTFQTPKNLFLIIDYWPRGDLALLICKSGSVPEQNAMYYIAEIILSIEYIHKLNILYRDLKPENILIDASGHLKLADFNLAKDNLKIG